MFQSHFLFRLSLLALIIFSSATIKKDGMLAQPRSNGSAHPVRLVNGYPQFHFNGQPFFAHSAAFFYNRIPRAEWGASLARLKL